MLDILIGEHFDAFIFFRLGAILMTTSKHARTGANKPGFRCLGMTMNTSAATYREHKDADDDALVTPLKSMFYLPKTSRSIALSKFYHLMQPPFYMLSIEETFMRLIGADTITDQKNAATGHAGFLFRASHIKKNRFSYICHISRRHAAAAERGLPAAAAF